MSTLAQKTSETVTWALRAVTFLLLSFIVIYGRGVVASVIELKRSDTAQNLKLVAIEASRYTIDDAKADNAKVSQQINGIKVESAGDSAKLDGLRDDITELRGSIDRLSGLIYELERKP